MLKYIRAVIVCGPRILWSYFAWMIKYSRHPEKYPLEKRYNRLRDLIIFVFKRFRIDYITKGTEIFNNEKKFVLIANHYSSFDPLFIIAISKNPITFVAKKESAKIPFIGKCVKMLEGVFLDRNDVRKELFELKCASELVKNNYINVCIFPEGTRNKNPENSILSFKPGALKLAYYSNADLVVAAHYGSHRVAKIKPNLKKNPVHFFVIKSYSPEDYKDLTTTAFAPTLHTMVNEKISELRELDKKYLLSLKK